jgi:hypothetical protein
MFAGLPGRAEWGEVPPTADRAGSDAYVGTVPAPTGATALVRLVGQVQLDQGRFLCGIRNQSEASVKGVVRFLDAAGTELKAPACSFDLPRGKAAWRMLPVGTTTRDEPSIDYLLLLLDAEETKAYRGRLECRSGALERTPGDDVGAGSAQAPRTSALTTHTGALPSLSVGTAPVIAGLEVLWGDAPVSGWREAKAERGRLWRAVLREGTNQVTVAELGFDLRDNDRGDYLVTLSYSISTGVHSITSAPAIQLTIPWALAGDAIVARRIQDDYSFAGARRLDAPALAASGGRAVVEWGLVCGNDWLYIDLDSAWADVGRAGSQPDADLILTLHSRAAVEPLRGGSAGAVQFFVHLPVGLK